MNYGLLRGGCVGCHFRVYCMAIILGISTFSHQGLTQTDTDEAYDPFSDYSDFDDNSDMETDTNFFKNGRFFTVGFTGGLRGYTDNWSKTYQSAPVFGLGLTYFMDLQSAMAFGLYFSDSSVAFTTNSGANKYTGGVSFSGISFDYKHYFNTQNVTKGLADLNPYLLGGFTQHYRSYRISSFDSSSRDESMGVNFGAGIEIPLNRKKSFLGLQGVYRYVNFKDETKQYLDGSEKLDHLISGDMYDITIVIGTNY